MLRFACINIAALFAYVLLFLERENETQELCALL